MDGLTWFDNLILMLCTLYLLGLGIRLRREYATTTTTTEKGETP